MPLQDRHLIATVTKLSFLLGGMPSLRPLGRSMRRVMKSAFVITMSTICRKQRSLAEF